MADRFVADATIEPDGYRQVFPTSAVGVGPGRVALIQCLVADVRWRDDGTDPTTTVGMLLQAGATLEYTGDLSTLRFIEVTAGAELNVSTYK